MSELGLQGFKDTWIIKKILQSWNPKYPNSDNKIPLIMESYKS
jgi:hypothetical protein